MKKTFKTWARTSLGMISAEVPAAAVVDDEATIMDCWGVVVSVSTSGSSLRTDGVTTDELIILFTILLLLLLLLLRLLPNSIEVNWFALLLSLAGTTMGIADWCWREPPILVEKMCEADDCECELVDIAAIAALLSSASAFLKYFNYFQLYIESYEFSVLILTCCFCSWSFMRVREVACRLVTEFCGVVSYDVGFMSAEDIMLLCWWLIDDCLGVNDRLKLSIY